MGFGDISANTSQFAMGNGPFIDDLPIGMVILYSYVKLPEGRFGVTGLVGFVDSLELINSDHFLK